MRVISGSLRGMKLLSPEGLGTRPTLDRVKEALFSMLTGRIADAQVLDLFAGSGALGIEALSRYAAHCTFVDREKEAVGIVKANIIKARLSDRAEVILGDSIGFLKSTDRRFDIIFIDPPYKAGLYDEVFGLISQRHLLKENGVVAAECSSAFEINPVGFKLLKDKTYGKVRLCLLEDGLI